jgi:GntR family transcriptional repressor for pyruvate dehydrogenase complex
VHAFHEVRTRKTFEEAIRQIADAIRVGDLREGDRLPAERTLAAQMRISRPSLREALKLLADAGVLEVRPGGGTFVSSEEIPPGLLEARSEIRVSQVAGVLEARRLIEPRVAQLASLRATDDDLATMQRTIELQRACTDDRDRFLRLDRRFHHALARATANPTVVRVMDHILSQLEIVRDMALYGHVPEWSITIHERTLEAVRNGDLVEIEAVMDEHLSRLESVWREEESAVASARWLPGFLFPATRA